MKSPAPSPHFRLRELLSPQERLLVDRLNLSLWAKHGKFRAYGQGALKKDAYLEFDPDLVPEDLRDTQSPYEHDDLNGLTNWHLEGGYF